MDTNEMENTSNSAESLHRWAMRLYEQGKHEEALDVMEQALERMEQTFGPNHPFTAKCLNNLGVLYQYSEELAKALPLLERALRIRQASVGNEHPLTAYAFHSLAVVYGRLNAFAKALALQEQAIAIMERYGDANHPDTRFMRQNREELLRRMQKDKSAKQP